MRWLGLILLFAFLLCSRATAQPANVNRTLCNFDFEERRLGNDEDLPMNWVKVEGDDLPHYVNGELSSDRAHSGKYSFRFDLNGGSLIYQYPAGRIRVQPGAHYRIECYVQTTPLPNARAVLSGYFTDLDGHELKGTRLRSEPYAAPPGAAEWKHLSIELSASDASAGYLVIELGLLQPAELQSDSSLGDHALHTQDIHGSAWFDDVSVSQVPKVSMSCQRPGNIFRRSDPLRLQVIVNDRFTDDLQAQLLIRDADGKTIFQRSGATMGMASPEVVAPGVKRFNLLLPDLPPGWYEVAMVMQSQGQFVGEQTMDLIRLADDVDHIAPDQRFGIDATKLPFAGWAELPDILPQLGAGRVKLAVWSEEGDIQQIDSSGFDNLLERLQELGIIPTACLVALPPDISRRVNGSWLQLLKADRATWQPQLAYMVARHANHLDRWQIGAEGSAAFVTEPDMRRVYQLIYKEFSQLMQHPDLAMPWPAWYDLSGDLPATVSLSVPPEVLPQQVPLYMQDLRGHDGHNLSILLQPISRERYGRETQVRDFARRFAYTVSEDAQRVVVELPFTVHKSEQQIEKEPMEMFMVVRTLTSMLSGATYKGQVPIADGVEAFLFDRNGQGILMLWDKGSEPGVKSLALNLGMHPARVDLWGNVTPLLRTTDDASTIMTAQAPGPAGGSSGVPVQITSMPFFLVDVDGQVAQFRASIHFDNDKIESSFKEHQRHVLFTNPYRQAIGGMVKFKAPPGWTLSPPTINFTLNPGETLNREISIQFPYNSFAGSKTIEAEFELQADRISRFTVPLKLKLGLSDVGLQTLAIRDNADIIVQQVITNYGDKPIDYTAFAICPGQARQERLVTGLGAGRTVMKKYRFKDVKVTSEMKVRSGLKESEGTRILNDEVEVQ